MSINIIDEERVAFKAAIRALVNNDRILEGLIDDIEFNTNLLTQIYTKFGIEKQYETDILLGNALDDYDDWSHIVSLSGYSIWSYPITNFLDDDENQMFNNDISLSYRGEAGALIDSYFDYVINARYEDDATPSYVYTDLTSNIQNEGASDTIIEADGSYLYIGDASTFIEVSLNFYTTAVGLTMDIEYYDGADWTPLDYTDETSNLSENGDILFSDPGDWAETTVDGNTGYFIRIVATSIVNIPEIRTISMGDSVTDLLRLTSTEKDEGTYSWCFYNDTIYVTIPNTANSTAVEGIIYITADSTIASLKNYFITNNEYKVNYAKADYDDELSFNYLMEFDNTDLGSDDATPLEEILVVNHALDSEYPIVQVYNNDDEIMTPDVITYIDSNTINIDFTSFIPLSGTWHTKIVK